MASPDVLRQLADSHRERLEAETRERAAILAARDAGATLQAIADVVGVTRQRIHQITSAAKDLLDEDDDYYRFTGDWGDGEEA